MAAWEPPINPFTGSPETPDARLPPSLRPRMGKGRAYVLLAVDAHGEWRGTGAACDTPAAAEQAWLAQRGRGCALLRLGASGWEVLRARGPRRRARPRRGPHGRVGLVRETGPRREAARERREAVARAALERRRPRARRPEVHGVAADGEAEVAEEPRCVVADADADGDAFPEEGRERPARGGAARDTRTTAQAPGAATWTTATRGARRGFHSQSRPT
ncbi:hypothetical protein SO694_00005021 [Aureococcus anophagefferens]|uniref:Uncharacterized protein n=1 Tax=Aureococcus anophagefferens TaxID=44056 RepID=A0ABR1G9Z3_AURAN